MQMLSECMEMMLSCSNSAKGCISLASHPAGTASGPGHVWHTPELLVIITCTAYLDTAYLDPGRTYSGARNVNRPPAHAHANLACPLGENYHEFSTMCMKSTISHHTPAQLLQAVMHTSWQHLSGRRHCPGMMCTTIMTDL